MLVKRKGEKQRNHRVKQLALDYYTLSMVERDIDKKEVYLQEASKLDSTYLDSYLSIYEEYVAQEDYEKAYASITRGEKIAHTKNIPVNMTVSKLLLGRLLDKTNNSCLGNSYYGLRQLDGDVHKLYREAIWYTWLEQYELAYEIFYYLGCISPEYDFKTILLLIEKNTLKEWENSQNKEIMKK